MWALLATVGGEPDGDTALVASFQGGDVRAFDRLFARYRRPIFGYVYRSVGSAALAEELTQDVFLKAFLHLRQAARGTVFRAWIYRIATTTCIDAYRSAARAPVQTGGEAALLAVPARAADNPEARQVQSERQDDVRRALAALPLTYRQVLILRQVEGLSYGEIGEALGLSVDAVTSLLHRARRAFRAAYGEQHGGAS